MLGSTWVGPPSVSSVWLTLCTTAHTLWPPPPTSLPSVLQIYVCVCGHVCMCVLVCVSASQQMTVVYFNRGTITVVFFFLCCCCNMLTSSFSCGSCLCLQLTQSVSITHACVWSSEKSLSDIIWDITRTGPVRRRRERAEQSSLKSNPPM